MPGTSWGFSLVLFYLSPPQEVRGHDERRDEHGQAVGLGDTADEGRRALMGVHWGERDVEAGAWSMWRRDVWTHAEQACK